jgi:phosphoribosylamine---glycine ligase
MSAPPGREPLYIMTRVLLICDSGDGLLDLALRAQDSGHQVRMFLRKFDPRTRPIGKGLVELVANWQSHIEWSDLAILETNGVYMSEVDNWRRRGCVIIGGNAESAAWELDRTTGMNVFRKAGIPIPEFREFNDYDSAIRYVERVGEVMYSKPCSDTPDKSLSAKTGIPEDPSFQLRRWKKKHTRPPSPFLLQEAIDGIEFAVGGWFGPSGFSDDGWEENFEGKKLFAGDIGPNTGEMHTVMRYVKRSKLAEKVLLPCEEQLSRLGYIGNIDVNCIIDANGNAWPLEWTVRLGWPSFNIECALFTCDPIEFLMALALGESTRGAHRINEAAIGVVVALPPYPYPPRDYEDLMAVPVYGEDPVSFHPCEIQKGDETPYASAGYYLAVVTGTGETVRAAARSAYKNVKNLSIPASPFWRNDAGQRLRKDLPKLQQHGFAQGMEW